MAGRVARYQADRTNQKMYFCFIFDIIILKYNWRKYENNRTYTTLQCGRKQTFYA